VDIRAKHRALLIALLASLVLWNLPFGGLVLYPLKLFATWLHELSHGLVMLLTGAGFDHLEIYRDTSGLAYAEHGMGGAAAAAIASAGYMGTPLFGSIFLVLGQTRRGARSVLAAIGLMLVASAVLFVRGDFGVVATAIGALGFLLAAAFARESLASILVNFVAAQSCINALLDIRVLFRENLVVNGQAMQASDAHSMSEASFGPPWLWAGVWLVWSLVLFFAALRLVFLRQQRAAAGQVVRVSEPAAN